MAYNDSDWTSRSGNLGGQYSDPGWSSFMNNNNIGGNGGAFTKSYSWDITFNNFGKQIFDTAVDDYGGLYINGVKQFDMGGYGGQTRLTTPGYFSPGTYTITLESNNSGGGPWGVAADWVGYYIPPKPTISSFSANPNPQNSSNAIPSYSTTISWAYSGDELSSATLTSSDGESWNVFGSTSLSITNLPQSVAGTTSPATRTYYLQVCNVSGCTNADPLTVSVYNDNTPSNSWTTSFSNLEPNTQVTFSIGTLSGVDMPTTISAAGSGNFVGNGVAGQFSASRNYSNGDTVWVRTTTLPFNTDISGETGIYGKSNTKTVTITTPSGSFNVSFITRPPIIAETFNYNDVSGKYPYEDIDLINNTPTQYATSAQITCDDIELSAADQAIEIRSDNPDLQVSINNGNWQNVKEI